jgi:hypothetical protein
MQERHKPCLKGGGEYPSFPGAPRSLEASRLGQHRAELAGPFESVQLIETAKMRRPDENLRDCRLPIRAREHFVARFPIAGNVDLDKTNALTLQKCFRHAAIGAKASGVDPNFLHVQQYKRARLCAKGPGRPRLDAEFAGRPTKYEKRQAGNSIVVRNQSDRDASWDAFKARADAIIDRVVLAD